MPGDKLTLGRWHEQVPDLPPLIDRLAFDLVASGHAPANAIAEAVKTLDLVGRTRSTQMGTRVPGAVQNAARDAVLEWRAVESIFGEGSFPADAHVLASLDEAADSLAKASTPEPVGPKPLWKKKGWHLPYYIEHIANDLREKRGMTESRAIATAIAAVKRWARGGGKVDAGTKAAAVKALAEWEAMKSKAKGERAAREAKLVHAVSRLAHVVQPIPNQATFAKRYAHRLSLVAGVLSALRDREPPQRALDMAVALTESADTDVVALGLALAVERELVTTLMEALGYGSQPIRASEKGHKGKFHGMHGVERAVRKRTHIPSQDEHPVLAAMAAGGLREAAAAALVAPQASPAFEGLHPRVAHGPGGGEFAAKGGMTAAGQGSGGSQGGGAAALVASLKAADPQLQAVEKQIGQSVAFGRSHSAHSAGGSSVAAQQNAAQAIQNVGYANDAAGISQFQKDYGLPVTGALDATTMQTVMSAYRTNARYAASQVPDFTGIAGAGARLSGKRSTHFAGRKTLGVSKPSKLAASDSVRLLGDRAVDLVEAAPPLTGPPGTPYRSVGGADTRQPGGDDFDFDDEPQRPPNLRPHEGVHACATCVHFSPAGWITEEQTAGGCMAYTWPVNRLDVCDDWMTLSPPDATLRVFEARLAEAEESGDGGRIVEARAAVRVLREREPEAVWPHPADQWLTEALLIDAYFSDTPRSLEERSISLEKRRELAAKGQTLKRGTGYPIESLGDLDNAVQAFGRAKPGDRAALKALLLKMARKLSAPAATVAKIRALSAAA